MPERHRVPSFTVKCIDQSGVINIDIGKYYEIAVIEIDIEHGKVLYEINGCGYLHTRFVIVPDDV